MYRRPGSVQQPTQGLRPSNDGFLVVVLMLGAVLLLAFALTHNSREWMTSEIPILWGP